MKKILFLFLVVFLTSCSFTRSSPNITYTKLLPITNVEETLIESASLISGTGYVGVKTKAIEINDTTVIIPELPTNELNNILINDISVFINGLDVPFKPKLLDFSRTENFHTVSLSYYISDSSYLYGTDKFYFSYNTETLLPSTLDSFFEKTEYDKIIKNHMGEYSESIKGFSVDNFGVYVFADDKSVFIDSSNFNTDKVFYVFDPQNYQPVKSIDEKFIALTFDDGPNPNTTVKLLEILEKNNAKATFFMVGYNIEGYKKLVKDVYNSGHDIGIHSYKHSDYSTMKSSDVMADIDKCANLIYSIINKRPYLVRPPFGNIKIDEVKTSDYFFVNWNVDSLDWKAQTADEIANEVLTHIKSGSIVLLHDIFKISCEATEIIIKTLSKEGYRFVTVSEFFDLNQKQADNKIHYFKGDYNVE